MKTGLIEMTLRKHKTKVSLGMAVKLMVRLLGDSCAGLAPEVALPGSVRFAAA